VDFPIKNGDFPLLPLWFLFFWIEKTCGSQFKTSPTFILLQK
jgi:hypothetical protein